MQKWGLDYLVVTLLLFAAALFMVLRLGGRTGDWAFDFLVAAALFAGVLFVAHLLESLRFWWRRRKEKSRFLPVVILLVVATVQVAVATNSPSTAGVAVVRDGSPEVTMNAVPYASGGSGTDYLTVAHGMRVGAGYEIVTNQGRTKAVIQYPPCSGIVHGIEALILRVTEHRHVSITVWGEPADLRPGDDIQVLPWRDLRRPLTVPWLHRSFGDWADLTVDEWSEEFIYTLVAEGLGDPALSGAPWVRQGRAYGIHKATIKAKPRMGDRNEKWVVLAESLTRIKTCLEKVGYEPPL